MNLRSEHDVVLDGKVVVADPRPYFFAASSATLVRGGQAGDAVEFGGGTGTKIQSWRSMRTRWPTGGCCLPSTPTLCSR